MRSIAKNFKPILSKSNLYKNAMISRALQPSFQAKGHYKSCSLTTPLQFDMSTHVDHHRNIVKASYEGPGFYV